ncbi:acyl-CoA dehydrogenase family protein [Acidocella sp.]|uniref:acyl-CoA dehydrogenase family protein n=1 Tax=Acidocella sp. TaxID=50710 RepID=UPI003CFDBDD3
MDLHPTAEERAFRAEIRDFIARELPADVRRKTLLGAEIPPREWRDWQRKLNAKGWAVPHWPVECGGNGWSAMREYILLDELQLAPAPMPLAFNVSMVGPVIARFGSAEQKARFLPATANLDIWWCQGFSEPGAGSDLASLKTTARREGDHYVVNGQKTWTSLAQYADWIFLLARTDPAAPRKQQGISFLLADMKTPGITMRPIQMIDGGHEVNEVFFDEARIPVENLVGEENKGWDYAKFLLTNERNAIARVGTSKQRIRRIKQLAATMPAGDATLLEQPWFREKLAAVEVELQALEVTQLRAVARAQAQGGHGGPDPNSSVLKIKGSELQQATTALLMDVAGPHLFPFSASLDAEEQDTAHPTGPDWAAMAAPTYFNWRKISIYGGANEIQRGIIAKAILGL